MSNSDKILEVNNLTVDFFTRRGTVHAVRDVSFSMARGETLGIVGESGSGKSVTAQAILGLTELPGKVTGGDVLWKGQSLVAGADCASTLDRVRGKEISMVFQDPMTSLNPVYTVGMQISEVLVRHMELSKKDARARALDLLQMVGISNPVARLDQYPFEMSGGMRQRILIAAALACEPELLIADEPTTALDVTIQAQILDLIAELQQRLHIGVILITHDLGVVAGVCDRVAVMYGGKLVEEAEAAEIYPRPYHPYTQGLLRSTPRLDVVEERLESIPGSPPDLREILPGCSYAERCPEKTTQCLGSVPALEPRGEGRRVACFNPRG
jgi:oligopeptide/dipeptide ABC transporter ATP-binding protein